MPRGSNKQAVKTEKGQKEDSDLSKILKEIRLLREEMTEVKQQITTINTKMSFVSNTMDYVVKEHCKQLKNVQREITFLSPKIESLEYRVSEQEQERMKKDLEIIGVPESESENLTDIVLSVSQKIGVELKKDDIDHISRVGPRQKNQESGSQPPCPLPIVVRLLRKQKRDELVRASKSAPHLAIEDPSNVVFVNEQLSRQNRYLFQEVKARAREYEFKFSWVKNGGIYVRKEEGGPAERITSWSDLETKVGPSTATPEEKLAKLRKIYPHEGSNFFEDIEDVKDLFQRL